MNVVLAIDSFKGCASSQELSSWIEEGIKEVYQEASVTACYIADGGEGMLAAIMQNVRGEIVTCKVHDPLMNPISAQYGILEDGITAVIEMAQAGGLPLVPKEKRNPLLTTTFGVGEMVKDAIAKGCRKFIVGIGGSATNDAALGMLQALGYRFLDEAGNELGLGGAILESVHHVDESRVLLELKTCEFTVACDVDNVMFGPSGSAHIYAAQKGADAAMIERLDAGMKHFTHVLKSTLGKDVAMNAGSGAAGGMGGGMQAFLDATLRSGIEIILDQIGFAAHLKEATLVITGEGRIDQQSLMGKVLSGVSKRAQKAGVPLIALGGGIADELEEHEGVDALFSIMRYPMSLEEAMEKPRAEKLVKQSVKEIFRLIKLIKNSAS
ncbi:glycerate kinase family protein [Sulfurospirillum multivorans]|uniref:Glycerate kinase n=2 Tax=Sulfurospirillum multivorans TaxID=66821 RepID=A0AA86E119_SULMK|nr:glycerate kinase [Sulfurospirillum multivorans]AHJ14445.1 glycerate kinase [Sulfurospirillum multivorans DSM 12446]QEH07930.1 glycerate kinase [Sulfurospirillum multivorans]